MANTVFLSNNLVPGSAISTTSGTVNSQFPLTNIQTDATTSTSRITTSATGIVTLNFQLPIDTTIDTIAVVGSNIEGFGYSNLKIRTSLTSDFSTATEIDVSLNPQYNFGYAFYSERVARNVQLEFTNTGAFVEVSKVYIGKRTTISSTYNRDDFTRELIRNDEIVENLVGNRFVNILNSRDSISGTYPLLESDNFLILESLFVKHGSYEPIWVMLDSENNLFTDGEFKMSLYCYFNNMFSHDLVGGGYFNVQVQLLEAV